MDVRVIKEKRSLLQLRLFDKIKEELEAFKKETGVSISNVYINMFEVNNVSGDRDYMLAEIECEITI